jgi:hypothetical protein
MQEKLFTDNYMMDLLDVDGIVDAKILTFNSEVIRKYFRKGILYPHKTRKGVANLSYRGSVIIRVRTKEAIIGIARANGKRLNIDDLGRLFNKAARDKDAFIVSRLLKGKSIEEIEEEFTEEVKKHLGL